MGADPEGPPMAEVGPSEVRTVIRAFNQMRLQLRGYLVERAQMLAAISHDLRTPITRLRLRAEMIQDPGHREKFVRDLDEMQAMAGSALEFFRSVGDETQRQALDVGALVESLCEDWCETGADVRLEGAPNGPYGAHPRALRRCLDNLVENALRYGERARITIEDDDAALRIAVRDAGPGIPDKDLVRVFEPFFRLERSRNRDSGGTGLGLAIARNIARWHGGDIHLRNAANGKGLTAELVLPRSPASAPRSRGKPSGRAAKAKASPSQPGGAAAATIDVQAMPRSQ
jgi:signal transduction histidine kinase